jgi:very-short-patch-repair endonuclease
MTANKHTQENTLSACEPELAKQWHPSRNGKLRPENVTRRNGKRVWWQCAKGHEWQAIVAHRTAGSGCPYCSGHRASATNNLLAVNPTVAAEWHPSKNSPLVPGNVTPNSGKKVWWRCAEGHEWEAYVSHRNRGSGCPYCSGRKASKKNNLATTFPDAAALWHPNKNGVLRPDQVTPRSSRKVWWRCAEGHEWEASVSNVAVGTGCPICINRIITSSNSLVATHPALASEWTAEKNLPLTPETIGPGSGKKVWWRCAKGHEWQATVVSRSTNGTGCPACKGAVASDEYNFGLLYPEEAKAWHPYKNGKLKPEDVTPHSAKRVWWLCPKGHETRAAISSRTKGHGCNKCKRKTSSPEIRIFSELKSVFEDVRLGERIQRAEADIYIPHLRIAFEYDGAYFHRGREDKDLRKVKKFAKIGVRLIRVRCRPLQQISNDDLMVETNDLTKQDLNMVMSSLLNMKNLTDSEKEKLRNYIKHRLFQNENLYRQYKSYFPDPLPEKSLERLQPEIAAEWDTEANAPLLPRNFTPYSVYPAAWKCIMGHKWTAQIQYRTDGSSCPTCREQKRKQGNYRERATCSQGHKWVAKYSNGELINSCAYCANKKAHKGYNLQTEFPEIASQWHPFRNVKLKPEDVTPGSGRAIWWRCEKGHEWKATIASRTSYNLGCAVCSGRRVAADFNLETEQPELAAQWHPTRNGDLIPRKVVPGGAKRVWWQCEKGHEWEAAIRTRVRSPACPYCAGTRADESTNLRALHPELMKEWHTTKNSELDPSKLLPGSGKKAWWRCAKGHEWQARIDHRTKRGAGCKKCADSRRRK